METNTFKLGIGGIAGLISYIAGNINYLWVILGVLSLIDFIAGLAGAMLNDEKFDKKKCMRGALIKILYFAVILIAILCDYMAINTGIPLSEHKLMSLVTSIYFIGTEGLGLIENLSQIGVPLPDIFKKFFENIKKE